MNATKLVSETRLDRRVAMVTAIVALLLGSYFIVSLETGAQTTSPVIISVEDGKKSRTVLNEQRIYIPIELDNSGDDTGERDQTLSMRFNFVNGANGFSAGFSSDDQGTTLPDVRGFREEHGLIENGIIVPRDQTRLVYLWVEAPDDGDTKSARSIQVFGFDNYGFLTSGANITKDDKGQNLVLSIKGVKDFDVKVTVDPTNKNGNTKLYQLEATEWGFTIDNEGYETDLYTLTGKVYESGQTAALNGWLFQFAGGSDIQITGSKVIGAKTSADTSFTITPPANAKPTAYDVEIRATSTNVSDKDEAAFTIPAPDFTITELVFSHTVTQVIPGEKGAENLVIATATVKNNGGNRDSQGHTTTHVDVTFSIQGALVVGLSNIDNVLNAGSTYTEYVDVLNHGDEEEVVVAFMATKEFDGLADDIIVEVLIDQANDPTDPDDNAITESNENNNDISQTFKVVKAGGSTPSFSLGFVALLGAALVLAGFSVRYRRKE